MKELLLEISYKCNFNCIHCSSINCNGKIKIKDLEKNNLKKLIDNLNIVRISGGEPLLNKDLIDYINYFYDRNIEIILQTNGFYEIPDNIYYKLKNINISIYSNKEVHNFITMNNCSFDKSINKIDKYDNIILCSPIFSLTDSINIINLAKYYNKYVRFTSLLNHGKCNFSKSIKEQIEIYNKIKDLWYKIESNCSLDSDLNNCDKNKYVITPDSKLHLCASTKQNIKLCKGDIK